MSDKVVLAFSGGLDTSYCVKYLNEEKKLEVHSAIINTGGFSKEDLAIIEEKAKKLGVKDHKTIDITDDFYKKCIKYLIFGNILRNNTYPLSVSSERIFQAIAIVEYAKKIGAKYIAHGSTGAGNDQVRFDLTFQILAPEITILTPIRDQVISRDQEIQYLKEHGIEADWKKLAYSINKGIWGTSIGGKETLTPSQTLPEEAYPSHLKESGEKDLELTFDQGELKAVNGKKYSNPVDAIREVEALGSAFAVGRDMHMGDTIIGIKGRVGFEAAAALIIIKAHQTLEKHVCTKWQQYWKDQLGNWYGMLLHEAQYLEPVMRDIEQFLESSQKNVTGKVLVKLFPYRFQVIGVESDFDLMNSKFGNYGEENKAWTGEDVRGFTTILANQMKIYYSVNKKDNIIL